MFVVHLCHYFSDQRAVTPRFVRLNAVKAANFAVKRRYFFQLNDFIAAIFRLIAVNAALFPVQLCFFFRLSAVNAAIFPVKRH